MKTLRLLPLLLLTGCGLFDIVPTTGNHVDQVTRVWSSTDGVLCGEVTPMQDGQYYKATVQVKWRFQTPPEYIGTSRLDALNWLTDNYCKP